MDLQMKTQGVSLSPSEADNITRHVERFERLVGSFPATTLHAVLQRVAHKEGGRCEAKLHLALPGKSLAASGLELRADEAFDTALKLLRRQLKSYKQHLSRADLYATRRGLKEEMAELLPPEVAEEDVSRLDTDSFRKRLELHTRLLRRHIGREMEALQRSGLLPDGTSVDDVVDDVFTVAFENFKKQPARTALDLWLLELAHRKVANLVREHRTDRSLPRLDETAPEPPGAPSYWDDVDGFIRFALWYEDEEGDAPEEEGTGLVSDERDELEEASGGTVEPLVPGSETLVSSEPLLQDRDAVDFVRESLALMPQRWRQALTLHYFEGYSAAELQVILDCSEEATRCLLANAVGFLKERYREARAV